MTDKYRCCCGCMHVETGTKIICGLFLITYFYDLFKFFVYENEDYYWTPVIIVLQILISVAPFIGIKITNPYYLIPLLCLLVIDIIRSGIVIIVFALVLFPDQSSIGRKIRDLIEKHPSHIASEIPIVYIIIFGMIIGILLTLLSIWLFSVVYKCYKYISDKKEASNDQMALPPIHTIY